MPREPMNQILGSLKKWTINAKANGRPAVNLFTSGDALDAKVYAGDGLATLFSPTVAWIDATQGTVSVSILPTMTATANITPGQYRIEVGVTPVADNLRRVLFYSEIRFMGSSGAGSLPPSLCTWADMINYSSDVAKLQNLDVDETQFAGQRNKAMNLFAQEIIRRYNPRPGGSRRYLTADGTASGSFLKYAPSPDGSASPAKAQVATWMLTPGRLTVNEDIVEANARLAAALVYGSSPGSNNPYQQMADKERALARSAIMRAVIEIDAKGSPDGNATIRVDRDVIYLT